MTIRGPIRDYWTRNLDRSSCENPHIPSEHGLPGRQLRGAGPPRRQGAEAEAAGARAGALELSYVYVDRFISMYIIFLYIYIYIGTGIHICIHMYIF